jgi:hypothetical protein
MAELPLLPPNLAALLAGIASTVFASTQISGAARARLFFFAKAQRAIVLEI